MNKKINDQNEHLIYILNNITSHEKLLATLKNEQAAASVLVEEPHGGVELVAAASDSVVPNSGGNPDFTEEGDGAGSSDGTG